MVALFAAAALSIPIAPLGASQDAEFVVATHQVQLRTNTKLFSYPVEAQRGEVWQLVKQSGKKVILTFGPDDPRRIAWLQTASTKLPTYKIQRAEFSRSFVAQDDWPSARRRLAEEFRGKFPNLLLSDLERVVDGEVWPGMSREAAEVAVGNRILRKQSRETESGVTETWQVGAFSMGTITQSAAEHHVDKTIWIRESSEPLEVSGERHLESSIRMVLVFSGGRLVEITRR